MGKKPKSKCCRRYKRGRKGCKRCPVMAELSKKQRKRLVRRYKT